MKHCHKSNESNDPIRQESERVNPIRQEKILLENKYLDLKYFMYVFFLMQFCAAWDTGMLADTESKNRSVNLHFFRSWKMD